jgi:hypothetical protein
LRRVLRYGPLRWSTLLDADEKLREWFSSRREVLESAAENLKKGVFFACAVLATLFAAIAVTWLSPREVSAPQVKVTLDDQSFHCGELLDTQDDGGLRIRTADGSVEPISASSVVKMQIVATCSSS